MASSNGERTFLRREQLWELEKDFQKQMDLYLQRVNEGYEWETDGPAVMRGGLFFGPESGETLNLTQKY